MLYTATHLINIRSVINIVYHDMQGLGTRDKPHSQVHVHVPL